MKETDLIKGLVMSGGGAWGAYELGVSRALAENRVPFVGNFNPAVFTGTSIGSFNAAYLVSRWDDIGKRAFYDLERIWFEQLVQTFCENGAYRIRFNPLSYLPPCFAADPSGTVRTFLNDSRFVFDDSVRRVQKFATSSEPFAMRILDLVNLSTFISAVPYQQTIERNVDFEAIASSSRQLRVVATNWSKGNARIFNNAEIAHIGGDTIMASSSLPGFFPPQDIGPDKYVDGGVLMNTPLKPAIRLGANQLEVINMTPPIVEVPLQEPPSTIETLYRMQIVAWAAAINRDIERVRSYNRAIAILEAIEAPTLTDSEEEVGRLLKEGVEQLSAQNLEPSFKDLVVASSLLKKQAARIARGETPKQYQKVVVHRFFPHTPLGDMLSLLDLRPELLKQNFKRGYCDGLHHDCIKNKCVL